MSIVVVPARTGGVCGLPSLFRDVSNGAFCDKIFLEPGISLIQIYGFERQVNERIITTQIERKNNNNKLSILKK